MFQRRLQCIMPRYTLLIHCRSVERRRCWNLYTLL